MKVKYGDNVYEFEGDLNCAFFKNLISENVEEVELKMYEDIFKLILENKVNFECDNLKHLKEGLDYFGSKYNADLYFKEKFRAEKEEEIKNYILKNEDLQQAEFISKNDLLSENFLEWYIEYHSKLSYFGIGDSFWNYLSFRTLSLPFLEKYKDKLCMDFLCKNKSIPITFFENNVKKVNWACLAKNESIPFSFFQKYNKEAVYNLANPDFLKKNIDKKVSDLLLK